MYVELMARLYQSKHYMENKERVDNPCSKVIAITQMIIVSDCDNDDSQEKEPWFINQTSTASIIGEVRALIAQAKALAAQAYREYRNYVRKKGRADLQSGPLLTIQAIQPVAPFEKEYLMDTVLPDTQESFFEEVIPARMKEMIDGYTEYVRNCLERDLQPVRAVLEEYQSMDIEGTVE